MLRLGVSVRRTPRVTARAAVPEVTGGRNVVLSKRFNRLYRFFAFLGVITSSFTMAPRLRRREILRALGFVIFILLR